MEESKRSVLNVWICKSVAVRIDKSHIEHKCMEISIEIQWKWSSVSINLGVLISFASIKQALFVICIGLAN